MRLIKVKDAAGRLPGQKNRKGSLRGIAGWTLLALAVVLASRVAGLRTYEENRIYGEPNTEAETEAAVGEAKGVATEGDDVVTVAFAGEPSAIALDPTNLQTYFTGATLQKKDENGEWKDIEDGEEVVLGNNYKLKAYFEGGTGFVKEMHWYLGDHVTCVPKTGAPIWDGTTKIGTYDLTEDGHVTVTLEDSFLENANQELELDFEMFFTDNEGDLEEKFPWSGNIKDHAIVGDEGLLAVEKTAGLLSLRVW